jgi:hypothetical protein
MGIPCGALKYVARYEKPSWSSIRAWLFPVSAQHALDGSVFRLPAAEPRAGD